MVQAGDDTVQRMKYFEAPCLRLNVKHPASSAKMKVLGMGQEDSRNDEKSQSDKFKEAAREHEADEDEARWEDRLRKLAKAKPEDKKPAD